MNLMESPQLQPTYKNSINKIEKPIVEKLKSKYGNSKVLNIIVLSEENITKFYVYERNNINTINNYNDKRPYSIKKIQNVYLDYKSDPRLVLPNLEKFTPLIKTKYSSLSDYMLSSDNKKYITVDLDYVWYTGKSWKGFELTTFYVSFRNKSHAESLVSKMNRRPSWQGKSGAHAMRKILNSAKDLSINYFMVCINTLGRVGSRIKEDGNVYYFPLTDFNISTLESGKPPSNAIFSTYKEFLDFL